MIQTAQQRRWWFATHPEFSSSRTGQARAHHMEENDGESEKLSPEEVDAMVDERLEYEREWFQIEPLKDIKFWFGTELASKSPAEKAALLRDEDDKEDETDSELAGEAGNDWWSDQPSGLPAADRSTYDKYEDIIDRIEQQAAEALDVKPRSKEEHRSLGYQRRELILRGEVPYHQITIAPNPDADSSKPFWEVPEQSQVRRFDLITRHMAQKYGIDTDLIRAIMYMETTHGY